MSGLRFLGTIYERYSIRGDEFPFCPRCCKFRLTIHASLMGLPNLQGLK